MKKLTYLMLIMVAATIVSCKKTEYMLYSDVARIQFGPAPDAIYLPEYEMVDTVKVKTFVYDNDQTKSDTVYFDIYASGGLQNYDRAFSLVQEQLPNQQNAVAGTHFVAFNDARVSSLYVIKAGQVHASVPIVILRDAGLKTATVKLKFKVVANDNFQLGETAKLWRRLEITDQLIQPLKWDSYYSYYYFGKYSLTKHKFLISVTGQKWDDAFINSMISNELMSYYQVVYRTALIDYNNAHPGAPLTDEYGELVTFP